MKQTKQIRPEHSVRLTDHLERPEAWGTDLGAQIFMEFNSELIGLSEGTLVPIDFDGLERSDISFQREAVVETLRRHRPRLLFVATNIQDPDLRTNLETALEKRGECLLYRGADGTEILGKRLAYEQVHTLERIWKSGEATSAQLVKELEDEGVKLSTVASRLTALWRAGLVERIEGTAVSGGREHTYVAVC